MFGINNYKKYGTTPTSHDCIKIFAIIIMIIDHLGNFFFMDELLFRAIGRIGFPIWFFLAGYAKPSRLGSEIILLALFLIIIDAVTYNAIFPVNALISILACRIFISYLVRQIFVQWQSLFYFVAIVIWSLLLMVIFEYGSQALLFALFGYLVKTRPGSVDARISLILAVLFFLSIQFITFDFNILESLIMIAGTIVTSCYLYNFKMHVYNMNKYIASVVMYFARNSLYVYVVHLVFFIFIEYYMHPENHVIFQWI